MTLFLKSSPILFVFLLSLVFGPFDAKGNKKEWKIVRFTKEGAYRLQHIDDKKLAHSVQIESPGYRFEEARMVKERPIVFLIYFAGSLGTYEIIDTYRAVVLNTESKKFYGDFPFRLVSSFKDKTYPDTNFSFGEKGFTVTDKVSGLKKMVLY